MSESRNDVAIQETSPITSSKHSVVSNPNKSDTVQVLDSPSSETPKEQLSPVVSTSVINGTEGFTEEVAAESTLIPRPDIVNPAPNSVTATYIIDALNALYETNPGLLEQLSQVEVKFPGENGDNLPLPESDVPGQVAESGLPNTAHYPIVALSTLPQPLLEVRATEDLHMMICLHISLPTASPSMIWRFSVARQFNLAKATEFLEKHLVWRTTALPVHYDAVEAEFSKLKYNFQGKDLHERFIVCINGARMGTKTYNSVEESVNTLLFGLEKLSNDLLAPTEKFSVIFNNYDAGYSNIDMEWTKRVANALQHNYPERLGCAVVLPANLLMRGVWKIAKHFFDPMTADKIHLIPGTKELDAFVAKDERIELLNGGLVERIDLVGMKGNGCSQGTRQCNICRNK